MPTYRPSEDELDGYSSEPAVTPPDKSPDDKTSTDSVDEENEKGGDLLIDKSKIGPDVKTGDTCTFRITADYGSEVALEYVPSKETGAQQSDIPSDNTEAEISALDTANP